MLAGRPVVYTTFLAYDEVAHHSGVERPDTLAVLRRVDRAIARIAARRRARAAPVPARRAVRPRPVPGRDVPAALRRDAGAARRSATRGDATCTPRTAGGDEGRGQLRRRRSPSWPRADDDRPHGEGDRATRATAERAASDAPRAGAGEQLPEIAVMASGNLGLISFPREPGRVTLEQIEARRPGLLDALRAHPGIGFVLVRSERDGAVVLGPRGRRCSTRRRRRGRGPAGAVRPARRRPRAPHRRASRTARTSSSTALLGGHGRGRGVRGAGRLARRPRRRAGAPVRAAPGRAAVAGRARSSAPRRSTACCAAGSRGSARTAYAERAERALDRQRSPTASVATRTPAPARAT